jgi:hypothetical protein
MLHMTNMFDRKLHNVDAGSASGVSTVRQPGIIVQKLAVPSRNLQHG